MFYTASNLLCAVQVWYTGNKKRKKKITSGVNQSQRNIIKWNNRYIPRRWWRIPTNELSITVHCNSERQRNTKTWITAVASKFCTSSLELNQSSCQTIFCCQLLLTSFCCQLALNWITAVLLFISMCCQSSIILRTMQFSFYSVLFVTSCISLAGNNLCLHFAFTDTSPSPHSSSFGNCHTLT